MIRLKNKKPEVNRAKVFFQNLFRPGIQDPAPEGKKLNVFQKLVVLQARGFRRYMPVPDVVTFLEWERSCVRFRRQWGVIYNVSKFFAVIAAALYLKNTYLMDKLERREIKRFGAVQESKHLWLEKWKKKRANKEAYRRNPELETEAN